MFTPVGLSSSALFGVLFMLPFMISVVSYTSILFKGHPLTQFFFVCVPYFWTYFSADWYIQLARTSSPFYHPCGCLAQCLIWVMHWTRATYYAFFVNVYTPAIYPTTIPCLLVIILAEGQFYTMISYGCSREDLGVYGSARRQLGRVLESLVRIWFGSWELEGEASPHGRPLRTSRTM